MDSSSNNVSGASSNSSGEGIAPHGRPPTAPQPKQPTLATNRFAVLSSSTVRKGNLLKSPVARDICKLTERMVVTVCGGTSQISQRMAESEDEDEEIGKPAAKKKAAKGKKGADQQKTPDDVADAEVADDGADRSGLVDVSSDDDDESDHERAFGPSSSDDHHQQQQQQKKGGAAAAGSKMSDERLKRIELQFAGGKKSAAKYAAKNCSAKNAKELLVSASHQELHHRYSHLLVLDFEATCDAAEPDYPHEIIEFPCVAVDLRTLKVVAEFGTFVKPVLNPQLTEFCSTLTTIQQSDVDGAPLIRDAISQFNEWLAKLKADFEAEHAKENAAILLEAEAAKGAASSAAVTSADEAATTPAVPRRRPIVFAPVFATDGPWDMRKFMHECHVIRDGVAFPELFYRWVDVRRCFSDFFHKQLFKLTKMLRALGMNFVGERHRGIDDSRNIARVAIALAKRGYKFRQTALIPFHAEGSRMLDHERAANALLKEIEEEEAAKRAAKKAAKKQSKGGAEASQQKKKGGKRK